MRDTPHVLMGVRASGVPDSSQSCVAKNDSRGVFVNSTLRASSTKTPNIAKKNSFHAGDPNMMATSPMKTRISPNVCGSPGGYFKYFRGTYPKNLQHKFTLPSEVHNTVVPGKWAEKRQKGLKSCGLQIPYSISKSFLCLGETLTCACSARLLRDPPWPYRENKAHNTHTNQQDNS